MKNYIYVILYYQSYALCIPQQTYSWIKDWYDFLWKDNFWQNIIDSLAMASSQHIYVYLGAPMSAKLIVFEYSDAGPESSGPHIYESI